MRAVFKVPRRGRETDLPAGSFHATYWAMLVPGTFDGKAGNVAHAAATPAWRTGMGRKRYVLALSVAVILLLIWLELAVGLVGSPWAGS